MTTLDYNTQFAWRKASFGRIRKVPPVEAARWRELDRYAVHPRNRRNRDWTHDEISHLVTLLDQGLDYDTIARRLGRTRIAILIKTKRLGCNMTKRPTVLTARAVAQLLGKGCAKSVTRWIADGLLTARASVCNGRRIWRVTWDDLMTFLHDPAHWCCWDAARITDTELRQELLALRADDGPWLTQGEVAARYHVGREAVQQWLDKGFLPFVHSGGGKGNRMIRERDLVGWVAPCQRSRKGIPLGMGRRVVGGVAIVSYERRAA